MATKTKQQPIDLNIVNRATASTYWVTANGVVTPDALADVLEQSTDNASALNSLPTPLARFFVAQEAFRRVSAARSESLAKNIPNNLQSAGFAYDQLVSDCLDLYELLFNLKYHRNIWHGKEEIEIIEWNSVKELSRLKNILPKLHNSLETYYNTDIKEDNLFFIIYKTQNQEYLLGSSSPFTGWVTPPDMDKYKNGKNGNVEFTGFQYQNVRIQRKTKGYYFDGNLPFENRDEEFQNYMYHRLFNEANLDKRLQHISGYIKSFQYGSKVKADYQFKLDDIVTVNNNAVNVNGLTMSQNDEDDVNSYFQSYIIELPFRLNSDSFKGVTYERVETDRNIDYLIPLNAHGLSLMANGAQCLCQVRKNDIVVSIKHKGKSYQKIYEESPVDVTKGTIKRLQQELKYLNIGVFPNILSPIEKENNYFKVVLIEQDCNAEYITLNIDKCALTLYKKNKENEFQIIEEIQNGGKAINGVYTPVVRSRQNNNNPNGTKYYELFNTSFDAIEIEIEGAKGFVIPEWQHAQQTADSYTYAIDLGTSNTFISRCKNGLTNAPVQLDMLRPMVSYLHDYKKGNQYSEAYYIESAMPNDIRTSLVPEFAPPMIDGAQYEFPIRTALCHVKGTANHTKLFDNTNIAFFYGKALETNLQEILTDIKWEDKPERLSEFVRELMLIIKVDVLQRDGMLSQTNIVRFRPLSFDGKIKNMNDKIWKTIPQNVFGIAPNKTECFTESEAPYYYFKKRNIINNTDTVTVIDIGGGSTDFVYFKQNQPKIASSVHFGCDEFWGEGHVEFSNVRENGIYKKYVQSLIFDDKTVSEINSAMIVNSNTSAKNIINFWLSNQEHCSIIDNLKNDFTPLFVYHFTALIYYMASMFRYKGLGIPKSVVFSGNGSKYIDNFITDDVDVLQDIIKMIFTKVYGEVYGDSPAIYVTLPNERKESTCYGGLYKDSNSPNVPEVTYHGVDRDYSLAKEIIADSDLKGNLMKKYKEMNALYVNILSVLKKRGVIDNSTNTIAFTEHINENFENYYTTHFLSEVVEKYKQDDDICTNAVFFIPIEEKIIELTKVFEK